jgi:hypothetical protein
MGIATCVTSRSKHSDEHIRNVQMKHLKHLKLTLATFTFSAMSPCSLEEWRFVIAKLDAGVEVGGGSWSSPVRQWHRQLKLLRQLA